MDFLTSWLLNCTAGELLTLHCLHNIHTRHHSILHPHHSIHILFHRLHHLKARHQYTQRLKQKISNSNPYLLGFSLTVGGHIELFQDVHKVCFCCPNVGL